MAFDTTLFPFLAGLPNPIRTDLRHVVFQQCDFEHAPPSWLPALKQFLKIGGSPLVQIKSSGIITRSRINNPLYTTPLVPPGSENKLILSSCSMASSGPLITSTPLSEVQFDSESSDKAMPIVNFIPYGNTIDQLRTPDQPGVLRTPNAVQCTWGVSGSMWTTVYLWAIACAAMPEATWNQFKADGVIARRLDSAVRSALGRAGYPCPNRMLPDLRFAPDFLSVLATIAKDVALTANTAGGAAPLSGFDLYWSTRAADGVTMEQAHEIWMAALMAK